MAVRQLTTKIPELAASICSDQDSIERSAAQIEESTLRETTPNVLIGPNTQGSRL